MEFVKSPFTRTAKDYKRDINIWDSYIIQSALMLHKSTGRDLEVCKAFVIEELNNPENKVRDPDFQMLERDENLDQKPVSIKFSQYINDLIQNEWLMAPTFTVVIPPHQKVSMLATYIKGNLKKRKEEKGLMAQAQRDQNEIRETLHNNNQNNKKILNNAISGNHRSLHSPLYDKASHPILTAGCRIANGSANSNNDRLLMGNRHYWRPDVVFANITSILELSDWDAVKLAVETHNLHIPTVEEVIDVIRESSDTYWKVKGAHRNLYNLVAGCNGLERAAIVYSGDLYHLKAFNEPLIRKFVKGLVTPAEAPVPEHEKWLKFVDEDTIAQVKVMFPDVLGKHDIWDDEVPSLPGYWKLGSTAALIYQNLYEFRPMIDAFLLSRNVPFLISDFPHAIRKAGVGSDTDSAIFTVQHWVNWYSGNDVINQENTIVAEALAFVVSQTTTHNLATMTTNMGVQDEKHVFLLSMKNEYLFPIFVLTGRAKHYWAKKTVQEGVYINKREKKGVELIASNSPAGVRADLDRIVEGIADTAAEGKFIEVNKYLRWMARWEYTIYESIQAGETTYLKAARVKEEDGYTKKTEDTNTPYLNYELWEEVFAPRYGHIEPPPYSALSFSIIHDTKKKTEKWLNSWEDKAMAERMRIFLAKKKKDYIGRILLPESIVMSFGIPEDILSATDIRKIIGSAVSPFYLVAESIGFYLYDKDQTRLVFDMINREDAFSDFALVESALRPEEPVEYLED